MKVLGIVSSPRRAGNSELGVKEILRTLPGEWEKRMIRLNELNIKYCTACYSCIPSEKKCKLDDDFDFFLEQVKWADKVVIAGPAYFLGFHTAFKPVLDRFLSVLNNYDEYKNKDCVFFAPYGRPEYDGLVKEDMIIFAKKLGLNLVDSALMVATNPGDSVKGKNLEILHRLASSLLNPPEKPFSEKGELNCPFCGSRAVTLMKNGDWRCTVCNGRGFLEKTGEGYDLKKIKEHRVCNFTEEDLKEHSDYLVKMKNLFLETKDEIKALQAGYSDTDWWVRP